MLPREPLRFLLADDPGARQLMAGLFIKELLARGDLQRCLLSVPDLAEKWQDERSSLSSAIREFHQR